MKVVSAWRNTVLAADIAAISTLSVALLAAIGVGGITGAWITAKKDLEQQQREIEQQMRARMLAAAEDFIGASTAALSRLRALDPTVHTHQLPRWAKLILGDVEVHPAFSPNDLAPELPKQVQASLDEASRQLPRVALIFGPTSMAATEAEHALKKMLEAWATLQWFHALARASESDTVEQRRELIVGVSQALGEAGFARASSAVPDLLSYVGNVAGGLLGGVVTNVQKPLDDASSGAMAAVEEASKALQGFVDSAGRQALIAPTWRPHKLTFIVDENERVVASATPKTERFWRRRQSAPP
jgi:hypothetical protein